MGLFKKILGDESDAKSGENTNDKENDPVFYADGEDAAMLEAFRRARESFGYFWRELYWENHRIIPGLNFACVKVAFSQDIGGRTEVEHMWINDVYFDGERVYGVLANDPGILTNVSSGDEVAVPLEQISDWMFAVDDRAYGGFSVQAMRKAMSKDERAEHDEAWGAGLRRSGRSFASLRARRASAKSRRASDERKHERRVEKVFKPKSKRDNAGRR